MTRRERQIVLALTIVVALTRFFAVAHGLFDWDEAQFANGVRSYDVVLHHPHPPGYPLFIGPAKLVHALGVTNEFRALQVIVVFGAMLLFPALFFFAREAGFDFTTAICGALIFAFLPNVWVYGGTGFSDVPATVTGIAACALLLRGRRDSRAYIIGAIVLGIAAGIRPLNLLMGAAPALIATWMRVRARAYGAVFVAMFLGTTIVIGSYIGAGLASESWAGYLYKVREQSRYVHDVDSWHNPNRTALRHAAKTFFLWPFHMRNHMMWVAIFAGLGIAGGIVHRRVAPLLVLTVFTPVAILSWLNLDIEASARYSIAYIAAHALLAAEGIGLVMLFFRRKHALVQVLFTIAVVLALMRWTWPVLQVQRTRDSPPVAALQWIRNNVNPLSPVYVHGGIGPQTTYLLPEYQVMYFESAEEISMLFGDSWVVDLAPASNGTNFTWPRKHLFEVLRRRNFEVSLRRSSTLLKYGAGWHLPEQGFRWMDRESKTILPAFGGQGRVRLKAYAPLDVVSSTTIEVVFNGVTIDRVTPPKANFDRTWIVPSKSDAPNELILRTSAVANPANARRGDDTRNLGLRVDELTWTPLQ